MRGREPTRLLPLLALLAQLTSCQRAEPAVERVRSSASAAASTAASSEPSRERDSASRAPAPPAAPASSAPASPAPVAPSASPELRDRDDELPKPRRLLVIGDSLSDPAVGGGGYIGYVRERCPALHVENRARGGFMVNQMRRRLLEELAHGSGAFSHAVVFGGVNDLYSDLSAGRSLERIQSDLSKIYGELKAHGVFVIAMTIAPWSGFKRYYTELRGERTRQLNAWIFEQQQSGAVDAVIDAHALLACGTPAALCPELAAPFSDGLHFGRLGQRRLGEALYEAAFSGCTAP